MGIPPGSAALEEGEAFDLKRPGSGVRADATVRIAVEAGRLSDAVLVLDRSLKEEADRLEFALTEIRKLSVQILKLKKEMDEILHESVTRTLPAGRRMSGEDEEHGSRSASATDVLSVQSKAGEPGVTDGVGETGQAPPGEGDRHERFGFKSLSERLIAEEALRDMESEDEETRIASLRKLGKMRNASLLPVFVQMLHDDHPRVRSESLKAAAATGEEPVIPVLHKVFFSDPSDLVRVTTLRCLCEFLRAGTAKPTLLIEALGDASPLVRASAARVIGWTQVREALPHLLLMLRDPNADVRKCIAETLELLHTPQAIESLVEVLDDEDPAVRDRVEKALCSLTRASPPSDDPDRKKVWLRITQNDAEKHQGN
jgi:hypothetical protein